MKRTLAAATLCLALCACNSTPQRTGVGMHRVDTPQWALTGQHPNFPSETHLTGFGVSTNRVVAEVAAVARLEEAIVLHALALGAEVLRGTEFSRMVTERADWISVPELGQAVQSDLAGSAFEYVAVRAINKGDLQLYARGALDEARRAVRDAPDPGLGGDFKQQVEVSARVFVSAARLMALRLMADGSLEAGALQRAENAAAALMQTPARVQLQQTGGAQRVAISGGAEAPLTMRLTERGVAIAGVPLRWGFSRGMRGTLDGTPETDAEGHASCRVLSLSPSGEEFGFVYCVADIDRMTPRRTGVAVQGWQWHLILPCRRNTELVLQVAETIDKEAEGVEPVFQPALREWCRGRSLAVAVGGPSTLEFTYRLRLEGSIDVATWMQGEIPKARTSGGMRLVDPADGRVLFEWIPGLLREGQPGNTAETLARTTLREAAADGLAEICTRLLMLAPAPGEEFSGR